MIPRYTPLKRSTKPIKRSPIRRKAKKSGIVVRGEREICHGTAWEQRRQEVHLRAGGRCERDGRPAPLHDFYDGSGEISIPAGHAHHKRKRGMGGGFRDDRAINLEWLCSGCHFEEHRPKRAVPKKAKPDGNAIPAAN